MTKAGRLVIQSICEPVGVVAVTAPIRSTDSPRATVAPVLKNSLERLLMVPGSMEPANLIGNWVSEEISIQKFLDECGRSLAGVGATSVFDHPTGRIYNPDIQR